MMFTMQEPYYGILLSSMDRVETPSINTLCVGVSGNVFKLYYNKGFIDSLPEQTVLELIKHEMLHLAFNHFTIWDNHEHIDNPDIGKLENIACDLEVNCYLDRSKVDPKAGGVWVEDFKFKACEGARNYFKALYKEMEELNPPPQGGCGSPDNDCNGGQTDDGDNDSDSQQDGSQSNSQSQGGGSSNSKSKPKPRPQPDDNPARNDPNERSGQDMSSAGINKIDEQRFDQHDSWPSSFSQAEKEVLEQAIEDIVIQAAEICEKSCGDIPGEMKARIEKLRKKPRPAADWKRYFRRYLGNEFSEFIRKSKKRESRRFPDAAGNKHRRKSHILVAIDTSGSISMPEYNEFMGQIKTLAQQATFHVVECDDIIEHEYDFNGKIPTEVHGCGGTSFQPPVDLFIANRKKYDALVYFTDGYAPVPQNTPRETLWVITSNGNKNNRNEYKRNGASVVFIPPVCKQK